MLHIAAYRHKFVRAYAMFLALYLILLTVLISIYDRLPNSGITKPYWYNVTYAVRAVMCLSMLFTSVSMLFSSMQAKGGHRLLYALYHSLYMLITCCVVYFDPVMTVLFSTPNLGVLAINCRRMGIAYMTMIIVYSTVYTISEVVGEKAPPAPAKKPEAKPSNEPQV